MNCAADATPLISVVLPVFNQADYLGEAIASVLNAASSFELIIVNDGSTDNRVNAVLADYIADSRIRIITQENQGIAAALNRGFADARGEFFTWTSADNRYKRGALKKLAAFLRDHKSVAMVYANVSLIDEHGRPLHNSIYRQNDQCPRGSNILCLPRCTETLTEFHDNFINACFLYRRDIAGKVGGYDSARRGYEDFDYWLRITNHGPIVHLDSDEALYDYRLHHESLTSELDAKQLEENVRALVRSYEKNANPEVPVLLRRARETCFHAVTSSENSQATALVFVPEDNSHKQFIDACINLLAAQQHITVVLLCKSTAQRTVADQIATALAPHDWLRIIDISAQAADPYELRIALLYVFSSVDTVCCFDWDNDLRKMNTQFAVAAMAGRNVVLVTDREIQTDAPHVAIFSLSQMKKNPWPHVGKKIVELRHTGDFAAMDSWLRTNGWSW